VTGITAKNKEYDRTTTATLDVISAALHGKYSGDTVNLDAGGYVATFASQDVGTGIAVGVTDLGLSGADSGNYTLTTPTDLTADITPGPTVQDQTINVIHDQPSGNIDLSTGVTNPSGHLLHYTIVTSAVNGTLTLNDDGTYLYTPNAKWIGTDSFTFKANDTIADSNEGMVTINVTNTAPTATNATVVMNENGTLTIPAANLFTDADGDQITAAIATDAMSGATTVNGDGSISYKPAFGFNGTDSFTVTGTDPLGASATATVSVTVQPLVYFSDSEFHADEGDEATLTVDSTGTSSQDIIVHVATSNGSAIAGTDYNAIDGTVTIPEGETSATFTVSTLTDPDEADGADFTVTLSNPTNAGLGTTTRATFTVFVTVAADLTPLDRLNTLSNDIDTEITALRALAADIGDKTTLMYAAGTTWAQYHDLLGEVNDDVDSAILLGNDINTDATDAGGAGLAQGEKFRIAGVLRDLGIRNTTLGTISGLLNGAQNNLQPFVGTGAVLPFGDSLAGYQRSLQDMRDALGRCSSQNANFFADHSNQTAGNPTIVGLNTTFASMQVLVGTVAVNDILIQSLGAAMTQAAADIAAGTAGALDAYNTFTLGLSSAVSVNVALAAGPMLVGTVNVSAYGLAFGTDGTGGAMAATAGDKFAQKGVTQVLDIFSNIANFNGYLDTEYDLVEAQQDLLEGLVADNVLAATCTTVTNVDAILNRLDLAILLINGKL
jgi:Bacterial Ig domain/YDG domain/Calx-beta domain